MRREAPLAAFIYYNSAYLMAVSSIQQAFSLAVQQHQAGRLHEADLLYRQILAEQPEHAEAMHLLGVIFHQQGQNQAAIVLIRQAISLKPKFPDAYSNLGVALREVGQFDEAAAALRQAIALRAKYPEAYNNLGMAMKDLGRGSEAIAAYRQAILLRPRYAEAYNNLGVALRELGQIDQAIAAYQRAIEIKPTYAEAYNNVGNAMKDKGQLPEAIAAYRQAIALNADYAEAHSNLGAAMKDIGQLDEAIAAFRQAIARKPNFPEAHSNLGAALVDKGQLDDAIAACRTAIVLAPNLAEARNNLGILLRGVGDISGAIAAFRQSMAIRPNRQAHSSLILSLHLQPGCDARQIVEECRRWNKLYAEPLPRAVWNSATEPAATQHVPDNNVASGRRLRIGYVSPDFCNHVVGRNLLPLFRGHDHREFEITCYSHSPRVDETTRKFQELTDRWRNISHITDEQAAQQIAEDRIDILIDLALHTSDNRLLIFARKPAPLQVTFAGYPGTTGLSAIDYRLSDPYLDPLDATHGGPPGMDESVYSETTVRLPDSFWCYDPQDVADISVNPLPAISAGVVTFGCLNNFGKINDEMLRLWAKVLLQVENSRLLLLAPAGSHRERIIDHMHHEGIERARIEFAPPRARRGYLQLYHQIDLSLDTFPYNGHTTGLDSFWMGAPVVTLVGQTAVSRAGWCQASNLDLRELAAHSPEQFVQVAVKLARDLPRLQELRRTLRARMERSPLMDGKKFAASIEAAYRQMWQTQRQTKPAEV